MESESIVLCSLFIVLKPHSSLFLFRTSCQENSLFWLWRKGQTNKALSVYRNPHSSPISKPPSEPQISLFLLQFHSRHLGICLGVTRGLSDGTAGKESDCSAGDTGDKSLISGSGRSPGGRNGNPL